MLIRVVSGLLFIPSSPDSPSVRVLMGQRLNSSKRGGLWETPGGKVDEGETPEAALQREWREELNLDIKVGPFIATANFDLEIPFVVDLYVVTHAGGVMERRVHQQLQPQSLVHAAAYLPCSPAFYVHYPFIRRYFAERNKGA